MGLKERINEEAECYLRADMISNVKFRCQPTAAGNGRLGLSLASRTVCTRFSSG